MNSHRRFYRARYHRPVTSFGEVLWALLLAAAIIVTLVWGGRADAVQVETPRSGPATVADPTAPDRGDPEPPPDHYLHGMPSVEDGYVRTEARYTLPDVVLTNADGESVALNEALGSEPVILNFIYTACAAICPTMSRAFSDLQFRLGRGGARMISISIDPERDTPGALKRYAQKYRAGPRWQMLTGDVDDSVAVQRAFDVQMGDRMRVPATFLRARDGKTWVRLDGFASAEAILREYRRVALP